MQADPLGTVNFLAIEVTFPRLERNLLGAADGDDRRDLSSLLRRRLPIRKLALGDLTEAEDIVSETFMRLLGSLEDLQVGTVKAYALAIARNGFISRRRRKGRDSELPDGLLDRFPPPDEAVKGDALPPLRREKELEVLLRTKRLVWVRDALFWIAVFLSATPLTVWDTSWGSGWLIRDFPWLACGLGVGATIVWCSYFSMKRRLSVMGR
ncbi:MAG: hypothetical protein FJ295_07025 [Planctomycetes bacterium]|nr:hypothetical protein [Planctomycetota bacterium]